MSNELIRELVEALETCKSTPLNMVGPNDEGRHLSHDHAKTSAALAKARAHLETGGWTRVEDGLPVVPTGELDVDILVKRDDGTVCREAWRYYETEFGYGITHWRYAEPTPEPPKG